MSATLLLVEDEDDLRGTLEDVFRKARYNVLSCKDGKVALESFAREVVDVVLLDLRLPDRAGLEVFRDLKARNASVPVVMMTAYPEMRAAVEAIKEGAYDYISKPFELAALRAAVANAAEFVHLRSEVTRLRATHDTCEFVGSSAPALHLLSQVAKLAAAVDTPVLLTGESGTGKEVVAGLLHQNSSRASRPMVGLNCSAIPENHIEVELFGHERGAFAGALEAKKGLFEMADGGTLFLDEVSELPLSLQPKLLRALEGRSIRRVGGLRDLTVDVRVVSSTNRDLRALVQEKSFREDLFFRLAVVELKLPTLRERPGDIGLLAETFMRKLVAAMGGRARSLSAPALAVLEAHPWPGNVRELRNVIERALILGDPEQIRAEDLPIELRQRSTGTALTDDLSLEAAKRRHVLSVLQRCGANRTEAARVLEISRSTLKELLKRYGKDVTED